MAGSRSSSGGPIIMVLAGTANASSGAGPGTGSGYRNCGGDVGIVAAVHCRSGWSWWRRVVGAVQLVEEGRWSRWRRVARAVQLVEEGRRSRWRRVAGAVQLERAGIAVVAVRVNVQQTTQAFR